MTNGAVPDVSDKEVEVVPENIRAAGVIYTAAMLEQLKIFQVADRLVELSQNGHLPLKKNSSRGLYQYRREAPQRLTERERKSFYARVLGIPGGDENVVANSNFNDLWIRFVSAVSDLARQNLTDPELRAIAEEEARAAGRELAQNLSLHGHGIAYFAATDLRNQIDQIVKLLGDAEIQKAYGARDIWQVVDQIATLELGGARDSARYRTLASSGAAIIAWLAKNVRKFSISSRAPLVTLKNKSSRAVKIDQLSTKLRTDGDLVVACEQWLAASGPSDS